MALFLIPISGILFSRYLGKKEREEREIGRKRDRKKAERKKIFRKKKRKKIQIERDGGKRYV